MRCTYMVKLLIFLFFKNIIRCVNSTHNQLFLLLASISSFLWVMSSVIKFSYCSNNILMFCLLMYIITNVFHIVNDIFIIYVYTLIPIYIISLIKYRNNDISKINVY